MNTWDYDAARLWNDRNGQEWLCIPWDPNSTYPEQLRRIADQWDAENLAEAAEAADDGALLERELADEPTEKEAGA